MKAAPHVIPAKWSWHHRALSRLRDTLLKERDERSLAAREPAERGGADVIDAANDACELESLLALMAQEQTELAEVAAPRRPRFQQCRARAHSRGYLRRL